MKHSDKTKIKSSLSEKRAKELSNMSKLKK